MLRLFLCMVLENVLISLLCMSLPFPSTNFEEIIFPALYIFAPFVIDHLTISAWVYFWAFYPVPSIYICIFVPVLYGFDNCSFAVNCDIREPDSSCSIFSFQYCFGYLRSFVFPYKFHLFLKLF